MKNKLLQEGLPEKAVDEILDAFDTYTKSAERLSKPKGPEAMADHMIEVARLAQRLSKKLGKLSRMEKQLLNHYCQSTKFFELQTHLGRLGWAANQVKGQHFNSARRPFLMELAMNLKNIFDRYKIPITVYRRTPWVQTMNILLGSPAGGEDQAFNLLRQLLRK